MGSAIIIAGLVAFAFIVLYMAGKIDEEKHVFLRIILFSITAICLLLIPKAVLDDNDYCSVIVSNATVSGSTTSYEYDRFCEENANDTSSIFWKLANWFIIIWASYVGIYYFYWVFRGLNNLWNKVRGRKE